MSTSFNPSNSIWPNSMKVDEEGYAVFYPLGTNKIEVPTSSIEWPKGDTLISPFVYQDDKLVGFVDTKALTVSGNTAIYLPYEHIEAEFSAIEKGQLQIHAPKAITKKASWKDNGVEDIPEAQFKYKGCKTVDDVNGTGYDYLADIANGTWSEPLWDLNNGESMFSYCENLSAFDTDLPSLTHAYRMFVNCTNLGTFKSDLSSLTNASNMFQNCSNLTTFTSDLSSLTAGAFMFNACSNLTSFTSDLSSLTSAFRMFSWCKLDAASIKNIAETINTVTNSPQIDMSISSTTPTEEEHTYLTQIHNKGWQVYVNGSSNAYIPATSTLDETGETMTTPIPFWAKPEPATEETARYIDSEGNFFNILGGQFIYVDDPDTYSMFTCEEDAAAQMRLTPYVKPETETLNEN